MEIGVHEAPPADRGAFCGDERDEEDPPPIDQREHEAVQPSAREDQPQQLLGTLSFDG
jgi:hypothetical protein